MQLNQRFLTLKVIYYYCCIGVEMRVAQTISLNSEQKSELERLVRSRFTSVRLVLRAKIILMAGQGLQNKQIASQLGVGRIQVARWRKRYLESGVKGIERDLPRGAPPLKIDVAELVRLTTQTKPESSSSWSTRKMGAVMGVSSSTIMRHWHAVGLKPHQI
jgi:transposase